MSDPVPQPRARLATSGTVVRYLGVGVTSYLVDLGLLAFCYSVLGLPLWLATSVGFWASFAVNFGLNRSVTFRSDGSRGRQLVRYSALVAVNYAGNLLIVAAFERLGLGYALGKTVSVGFFVIVNYLAYRHWVFKQQGESS